MKKQMRVIHTCINHSGIATYKLRIFTTGEYQNVYYCASCHARKPEHIQVKMEYIGAIKQGKKTA